MNADLQTDRLRLVAQSPEQTRALIAAMNPEEKQQLSADWLQQVNESKTTDPWVHGFVAVERTSQAVVGRCGFKGPPDEQGLVEIAYGVEPDRQNRGYATEIAQALVDHAFGFDRVRSVRAHTLPETNASTRVLTKCGFEHIGEVVDPEDGLVWRWALDRPTG